ncbi:MAG TPA: TIR domain-containing protein [Candidatus Elarobacter sp.]|nr:TIR domain-containing protein [Candidatus Elarobacter sp.]
MRDIFISYTHKDNLSLTDEELGWVDRFHRAIQVRLTQLLGRESEVFYDSAVMTGSDRLTPKIESEVRDTKILISIVSPGYLRSNWCNQELQLFAQTSSQPTGNAELDTKSRIVKVIKLPVEPALEKQATVDLSDVLGHEFYQMDKRGIPCEVDAEPPDHREFVRRVNELAYDIRNMLTMLGDEGEARPDPVAPSGRAVYVAETTSDQADDAEKLRRALLQYGHTVLPQTRYAYGPDYVQNVAADLAKADVSVHCIGASYGAVPERQQKSVVELQYDSASAEIAQRAKDARPPLRRFAWSPPGIDSDEPRQQTFIARLRDEATLLETPFETLKTSVQQSLEAPPAPAPEPPKPAAATASGDATLTVYLIFDSSDADAVKPLDDWLFDNGHEVLQPIFDGDEAQIRKNDESCLVACDAVLVFCGAAPADWLRQRVLDLQKAFAYGRQRPFLARGVVVADPQNADKDRFRSHSVVKMEMYGAFNAGALSPFLTTIQQAQTAAG